VEYLLPRPVRDYAALAFWYVVSLYLLLDLPIRRPANREAAALIFPERWFGENAACGSATALTHWIEVLTEKLLSVTAYEGYADSPDGPLWGAAFSVDDLRWWGFSLFICFCIRNAAGAAAVHRTNGG